MLCVILRHAQQLMPYYACFPKLARDFIKVVLIPIIIITAIMMMMMMIIIIIIIIIM